jgi:hypothetical protein
METLAGKQKGSNFWLDHEHPMDNNQFTFISTWLVQNLND